MDEILLLKILIVLFNFFFFILDESVSFIVSVSRIDRTEVSDKSRWTIKNEKSNGKIWDQAPRHFASDLRLDHSTQDPRYERRSRNSSRNPCEIPHQFDHGYYHIAPSLVTSGPGLVARSHHHLLLVRNQRVPPPRVILSIVNIGYSFSGKCFGSIHYHHRRKDISWVQGRSDQWPLRSVATMREKFKRNLERKKK